MQDGTNPIEAKKTHNSNLISKDKRIIKKVLLRVILKLLQIFKTPNIRTLKKWWKIGWEWKENIF